MPRDNAHVAMQVMHAQGKDVGIHEFICKPFRIEELHRVLNSTCRVKRVIVKDMTCTAARDAQGQGQE